MLICQINIENLPKIIYNEIERLSKSKAVVPMKINKFKRFLAILMCSLILVVSFGSGVAWADTSTTSRTSAGEQVDDAVRKISNPSTDDGVSSTLNKIANLLVGVAFALSIIKLTQIGFQFMLGAGKKSKAKESLIPWFVGVLICATYLFFGPWIMKVLGEGTLDKGPFELGF